MKVHLEKITLKEVRKLLSELYNKYFKYQNIEIEINSYYPINSFDVKSFETNDNSKVSIVGAISNAIDLVGLTKVIKVLITFIKFKNKGTINKSKSKYNRRRERDSFKKPYLRDGDIILLVKSF
mgnify:CR=1 FL=1|tara:strand:+ start:645 stop:1016 length:372 start_codon:yes stop_codon:yes gene_type:complete